MVRGPKSGNGTRSSVHYFDAAGLSPLRPRPREPRALDSELDPLAPGLLVNGQLMELGVPIAASGRGVVVSGEPAWLPAPPQAPLPALASRGSDPVAQSQLNNQLPAFFQAYASGDGAALSRFLARGVSLTGLGGAVTFDSIAGLHVPPGGATRQITVTVIWQLPEQPGSAGGNLGMASKLEMSYCMSVVDLQSGKWYVKEIGASTEAVGAR